MPIERIGERVFVYISDAYAQVTSTIVFTTRGSIVIDSLLFPSETQEVLSFARRGRREVRYLVNTHGHLDHVAGNFLFPDAEIIADARTREAIQGELQRALSQAAVTISELREVRLRPPTITGRGEMVLRYGGLTLRFMPLASHAYDGLGVHIEEERILVAGDAVLPVPHFVGTSPDVLLRTLQSLRSLNLNTIIQGHGDVILKGEVKEALEFRIRYLRQLKRLVGNALASGTSLEEVQKSDIESFGGSRLDLDGLTQQLHEDNIAYLYRLMQDQGTTEPA